MVSLPTNVTAALLSSVRQYLTKIEWLNWAEDTVLGDYTDYAISGSISMDASRDARRNFAATFNNASGLFVPNGALTNMGAKIRLYRGIVTSTGPYLWKRGIFVLSDPEANQSGVEKTVSLNGVDKWALHNGDLGGTLTETTIIPAGTNVADGIRAVGEDGGETKFAFDTCTTVTPYEISKEPGATRADLWKELALIPSWEIFYDIDGYLRFRPIVDPLNKQVSIYLNVAGEPEVEEEPGGGGEITGKTYFIGPGMAMKMK